MVINKVIDMFYEIKYRMKEWTKPEKVRSNDDDREAFMIYR